MIGLVALVIAIKEFADAAPAWPVIVVALLASALTLFAGRQHRLAQPGGVLAGTTIKAVRHYHEIGLLVVMAPGGATSEG